MDAVAALQLLRLKGRATAEVLSAAAAQPAADVLCDLENQGMVTSNDHGVYRLTTDGAAALPALLGAERAAVELDVAGRQYEEFCDHNAELKAIITAWQARPDGQPNDHLDGAYDAQVIGRLERAHAEARPVITAMCGGIPRLAAQYPRRLDEALQRVLDGDHTFVARPMTDSYHTVWFELHEELIGMLGRTREAEAAAGRA